MMKRTNLVLAFLFFFLAACASPPLPESIPETVNVDIKQKAPIPSLGVEATGLTREQVASLESLEMLDEYPLYRMNYYGSYQTSNNSSDSFANLGMFDTHATWACSLFTAFADPQSQLYGRNFDWEYSPALVLFTDPPGGYASVSMVDIAYLGYGGGRGRQLLDLPVAELSGLLDAPSLPFDGMNEHGLVVGMAAVPASARPDKPDLETIDSLMVIRLMLDKARNVDEALEIFLEYNLDWGSGPALHYLVADLSGRSILLEYWGGEVEVIENQTNWQAATNFLQSAYGEDLTGACSRYDTISNRMDAAEENLAPGEAMQLLAEVSQANTQWSVIYGMSDGAVRIVMGLAYERIKTVWLEMAEVD